jgi:phosphonate transport system ATP-binding protein
MAMTHLPQFPTRSGARPAAPPTLSEGWAVRVENLRIDRGGRTVLHDISLALAPGTVTAVVGRSGVGKTTLMGALNGLLRPSHGRILMAGLGDLGQPAILRQARRRTATIFQDHALIERLPAIDNVLLGLADTRHPLSPLPWARTDRVRAADALHDVGLLGRATAPVAQLSGGERQRVGIARALVRAPSLLLGDEPFASVDSAIARHLGDELRRLAARDGLTVLLVLHQIELARRLADRVIGLVDGRIAFDGPPAQFDAEAENRIFNVTEWGTIWQDA